MAVLWAQFWCKTVLKLNIAFSRCGNFIDNVITDWRKIDFVKNDLNVWESGQNISVQCYSKVHFYMKSFKKLRDQVLIIPKFQNWPWDHIFRYFDFAPLTSITQKQVFPITGTFPFVESHIRYYSYRSVESYSNFIGQHHTTITSDKCSCNCCVI